VRVEITRNNLDVLLNELRNGLDEYCKGGERAQRAGGCAQIEALVKLVERVFDVAGISAAEQGELFEPIRELHAAVLSLNERIRPRLLQPMTVGSRRPVEMPETMWRGEVAAAYELLMRASPDKDRDVVADEVATKLARGVRGKSIKEFHRNAKARDCPHPRLTQRFEDMLRLAATHFPGEPAAAAEKLIQSAGKQVR
jgi:hypothetical protein